MLDGLADARVLPRLTDVNRPFFTAAAAGNLVLPRCQGCGQTFFYPRSACPACRSRDVGWVEASGRGVVRVSAPVHRPPWDDLSRTTPYAVVLVELEEGPTMLSTVEEIDPAEVRAGLRVMAVFERVRDDLGLVRFVPAQQA